MGSGNGNNQWKISDDGYNVIIQIKFYSMVLLGNIVGPFCQIYLFIKALYIMQANPALKANGQHVPIARITYIYAYKHTMIKTL